MKAHKFRLQSILDLRAAALDDAKNALQKALVDLGAAEFARDEARRAADAHADQICSATRTQSASESQSSRQSFVYLTRQVQVLQGGVQTCQQAVQSARLHVVEASREHEILVRLKEKWLKVGQYLEDRKEENVLNDLMNSQRFQAQAQSREEFLQN